jgi:hypothetical protein
MNKSIRGYVVEFELADPSVALAYARVSETNSWTVDVTLQTVHCLSRTIERGLIENMCNLGMGPQGVALVSTTSSSFFGR